MLLYSGIHVSLRPNCHHQIVHANFNLHITYTPAYQGLIYDFKKADISNIRKALDLLDKLRHYTMRTLKKIG